MRSRLGICLLLVVAGGLAAWLWTHWRVSPTSVSREEPATSVVSRGLQAPNDRYREALFRYRTNQPTHWRYLMLSH